MAEPKFKVNDEVKLTSDGYYIKIFEIIYPKEISQRIQDPKIKRDKEIEYFCKWVDKSGKPHTGTYPESALLT